MAGSPPYRGQPALALPPSLAAPVTFNGADKTTAVIPAGFALRLISLIPSGLSTATITAELAGGKSIAFTLGPDGFAFLRSKDGFSRVTSLEVNLLGWLVVDDGSETSSIEGGGLALQNAATGAVVSMPSLGSVPFPISVPVNNAIETDASPAAGETWALDSFDQGPSAGVAGNLTIWANLAKTSAVRVIPLNVAGVTANLQGIEVISTNVIAFNVTAAGALATARVSGRRVA